MATYNGRRRIRRQLDSLAAQSRLPDELVVCDDCSDDDTIAVVEGFAKAAAFPVAVRRNETHLGWRGNFMRAASLCKSELISFCDQDDFWYSHKIAHAVKPFADPEVLLTYHNADIVTEDGKRLGSLGTRASSTASPWQDVRGFTEVFRRSLLQLSDLWPRSLDHFAVGQPAAHDQWFFFLANIFGRTAHVDESLVAYVQHAGNTVGFHKLGLGKAIRNRANEISRFANVAKNRAVILETAKGRFEGNLCQRAAAGVAYYQRLSGLYAGRSRLYTASGIGDRLKAFGTVIGSGGYADRKGLGHRALILDVCLGIPFGPRLPSFVD
jgi:glycosyltransferase involved in cell wall biosynthesis